MFMDLANDLLSENILAVAYNPLNDKLTDETLRIRYRFDRETLYKIINYQKWFKKSNK